MAADDAAAVAPLGATQVFAAAAPIIVAGPASSAVGTTQYIVQPGDTLWSLAERFHGAQGLAGYVDSLVVANGGSTLQPGQLLVVP